jgi:RNA polymerase sigma factor (sigma-70 family)
MPLKADPVPTETARARFEALWRAHYPDVFGFALRQLGDEAAAGDLTAETFTVAWRRFDFASDPSRAWLLAIARKLIANHRRGERRRAALLARVRQESVPAATGGDSEQDEVLAAAFNALAPRDREVLSLVTWHELTPAEAAEVLEITPARFSVRLHRAKARLRRRLAGSGYRMPAARPRAAETNSIGLEAE